MNDVRKIFASNLKKRRKQLKLTQYEFAKLIGYSEKTISKWEQGKAVAPSEILPEISKTLGISIDEMLNGKSDVLYYLGIDGGGTKTKFALANKKGEIIKSIVLSGSNPVDIGIENTFNILDEGIRTVCSDVLASEVSVFAGIAGGGLTGDYREKIADFLKKYGFAKVNNDSDAMNAVASCLGNKEGITIIIGTGGIAFLRQNEELERFGGYGYLFEDGGSGYCIARDGILSAMKADEGTAEPTLLQEIFSKEFKTKRTSDFLAELYLGGKKKIASYAHLVFDAYKCDDSVAKRIIKTNMAVVASTIEKIAEKTEKKFVKVVLTGGIATNEEEIILPLIYNAIKNKELYDITVSKKDPVNGALILAGTEGE